MLLALIDKLFSGIVSILPSSIVDRYPQDKIKHVIAGVIVGVASGVVATNNPFGMGTRGLEAE